MSIPQAADVRTPEANELTHLTTQGHMGGAIAWAIPSVLFMLSCVDMLLTAILSLDPLLADARSDPTHLPHVALSTIRHSGPVVECEVMSSLVEEYLNWHSVGNNNKPDNAWTALIRQVSPIALQCSLSLPFSSRQIYLRSME